jgi:hypothetical protein
MGAQHNRYSAMAPDPNAYHYGYVRKRPSSDGIPWYTIMATYRLCDKEPAVECERIPFWSNPNKNAPAIFGGDALGDPNREDNHQRLNDTASTVAKFRCSSRE